jgi:hypothetical protein
MGRGQGKTGASCGIASRRRQVASITPEVNYRYMAQSCRALAIAIHDQTGWPLVVVTDSWNVHSSTGGPLSEEERAGGVIGLGSVAPQAFHALVEHPSGELIDIQGGNDPIGLVEAYDGAATDNQAALGYVTREDLLQEHGESSAGNDDVSAARAYVASVLLLLDEDN